MRHWPPRGRNWPAERHHFLRRVLHHAPRAHRAISADSACAIEQPEPAAGDIPTGLKGEHWCASANGAEHSSAPLDCSFATQSARWATDRPAGLLAMAACARPCSSSTSQCSPSPCCALSGKAPAIPRPTRRRGACRQHPPAPPPAAATA